MDAAVLITDTEKKTSESVRQRLNESEKKNNHQL